MSGPFILQNGGDTFNGSYFNAVPIDGYGGIGVLYLQPPVDSEVFELYIGGKLHLKEQFSGVQPGPSLRGAKSERLVPVNSKVRP